MAKKASNQQSPSKYVIVLSILLVLLCCGEFLRIEIMLKEQKEKTTLWQNKLQDQIEQMAKQQNEKIKQLEKKMSHGDRHDFTQSKQKKRQKRDLSSQYEPDKINEENKLVQYIPKIIQAMAALQMEKKIPGPPGPPGKQGPRGVQGPQGPKGDTVRLFEPSIKMSPRSNLSVTEGQPAKFKCSVHSNPMSKIKWSRLSGPLPTGRATGSSSENFTIVNTEYHDTGIYKCKASNSLGETEKTVKLEVYFRPRIISNKQRIFKRVEDNFTLRCLAKGHPKPNITWSKSGGTLSNRTIIKHELLTIIESTEEDFGIYMCEAKNILGSDKAAVFILNIAGVPTFTTKPLSTYTASIGMTLILNCSANGNPKPVIQWSKEKGDLPVGRYERRDDSLILKDLNPEDAGVYVCTAIIAGVSDATAKTKLTLKPADCSSIYKKGERRSGVYTIWPDTRGNINVYCDMTNEGGGWTVFQRRMDGSVDFYRNWTDYKRGFGNLTGEFWLGNDFIHRLTSAQKTILRIDLEDWDGTKIYAKYGHFRIGSESLKYKLEVGSFSGNTGDSMKLHNNMMFTTKDRDNDHDPDNCATAYGAWWYNRCYDANLNGKYLRGKNSKGIVWDTYKLDWSLKTAVMKVRPVNFSTNT